MIAPSLASQRKDVAVKMPSVVAAVVGALALAGVADAAPVPQQFCQVQFVAGGPVYAGIGVSVQTPSGGTMTACRVRVPPPPQTIVMTFPDSNGDTVVITRGGTAIVIFRS
jgi:hypothetical protein